MNLLVIALLAIGANRVPEPLPSDGPPPTEPRLGEATAREPSRGHPEVHLGGARVVAGRRTGRSRPTLP